jgi:hypothetical protein
MLFLLQKPDTLGVGAERLLGSAAIRANLTSHFFSRGKGSPPRSESKRCIMTRVRTPKWDRLLSAIFVLAFVAPAVAQLETRSQPTTNLTPVGVVTADFNHDGKMDMAVASIGLPNEIQIFLGNGDGTFGAPTAYEVNADAGQLVVGDFNNDGNADLATTNDRADTISVLLGNGDGTFQSAISYAVPGTAYGLTLGDFNGDGNLDIAVTAGYGCGCVAVLFGNGDGTFQEPAITSTVPSGPGPVAAGHFGGSKNLDLGVLLGYESYVAVQVLLGNGDGTFTLGESYALSAENSLAIIAADLRNNGETDLAVAEFEGAGVAVLLGNGNGTFQQPVVYDFGFAQSVAAADMNGDGIPDLVAVGAPVNVDSGDAAIFYGNGDGTFQNAVLFPVGAFPDSVAVADFNGDHKPDVAVADENGNEATVLLNTGVVSFSPTSPLTFPTQLLGTKSKVITASLTNNGTSALTISSITLQGKPFAMQTTCGESVAVGGSCKISATFTPKARGSASGTVTINDSASSKPMVIELLGTATVVEFTPDGLTFPAQEVGTTSTPQTIQLTNIGKTALDFTYFMYVGGNDYNDFSETNNCPTDLNAGASCTITVTFTPKKTGTRTAAVYVTDNAGGSPQTVPLTGTGD